MSERKDLYKIFDTGLCPFCGNDTIKINRTQKPYRYYVCKTCKVRWKGVSVFMVYKDSLEVAAEFTKNKEEMSRYGI